MKLIPPIIPLKKTAKSHVSTSSQVRKKIQKCSITRNRPSFDIEQQYQVPEAPPTKHDVTRDVTIEPASPTNRVAPSPLLLPFTSSPRYAINIRGRMDSVLTQRPNLQRRGPFSAFTTILLFVEDGLFTTAWFFRICLLLLLESSIGTLTLVICCLIFGGR